MNTRTSYADENTKVPTCPSWIYAEKLLAFDLWKHNGVCSAYAYSSCSPHTSCSPLISRDSWLSVYSAPRAQQQDSVACVTYRRSNGIKLGGYLAMRRGCEIGRNCCAAVKSGRLDSTSSTKRT